MLSRIVSGCLLAAWIVLLGGSSGSAAGAQNEADPPPTGILEEVRLPPLGIAGERMKEPDRDLKGTSGKKYARREDPNSPYCKTNHTVRVLLWATSNVPPPVKLGKDVAKLRKELKLTPKSLESRFPIPPNEKAEAQLKMRVLLVNQLIARLVARMEDALEALKSVEEGQEKLPPRWQANHMLMRASLLLQIAHLEEHSLALGNLRKEAPPRAKGDRAWQLKESDKIHDFTAKKRVKEANEILKQLRREHAGTIWEQRAEILGKSKLGVEWEAVK